MLWWEIVIQFLTPEIISTRKVIGMEGVYKGTWTKSFTICVEGDINLQFSSFLPRVQYIASGNLVD